MRWNVTRPSLTAAIMPARPGWVSTIPAADLATSVAVETAIPICACRSAGASLAPSPHMDDMTAVLKRFNEFVLILRQYAGEDCELLGVEGIGDRPGRTDSAV